MDKELEEQRKILDEIAENCMKANRRFSECPAMLRQAEVVDKLVVEEHKLLKMLEEYEED